MRFSASALPSIFVAIAMIFVSNAAFYAVAEEENTALPSLGDLMLLTQLRYYKLWYAHKAENWQLVAYEERQFEQIIRRIVKLYPRTAAIAQANLIHERTDPAMAELRQSIVDKNVPLFESAYLKLTEACNQCHQAADVGFIVVRTPTKSPFSNQIFEPVR
jgi:hypothetical protein